MAMRYDVKRAKDESAMNAPKAVELGMLRRARIITTKTGSQTARTGTRCLGSMIANQTGSAPSRDQAHLFGIKSVN